MSLRGRVWHILLRSKCKHVGDQYSSYLEVGFVRPMTIQQGTPLQVVTHEYVAWLLLADLSRYFSAGTAQPDHRISRWRSGKRGQLGGKGGAVGQAAPARPRAHFSITSGHGSAWTDCPQVRTVLFPGLCRRWEGCRALLSHREQLASHSTRGVAWADTPFAGLLVQACSPGVHDPQSGRRILPRPQFRGRLHASVHARRGGLLQPRHHHREAVARVLHHRHDGTADRPAVLQGVHRPISPQPVKCVPCPGHQDTPASSHWHRSTAAGTHGMRSTCPQATWTISAWTYRA